MNNPQILTQDFNVCFQYLFNTFFQIFQDCHKAEIDSINEKLAFLENKDKPRKHPVFRSKKPLFAKKRKFQEQKSFSFLDFHSDAKMLQEESKASEPNEPTADIILQDMNAQTFAATLRKLEDSVDDEFFGHFFREMMGKMHKMAPKFKALVHEIYSKP